MVVDIDGQRIELCTTQHVCAPCNGTFGYERTSESLGYLASERTSFLQSGQAYDNMHMHMCMCGGS